MRIIVLVSMFTIFTSTWMENYWYKETLRMRVEFNLMQHEHFRKVNFYYYKKKKPYAYGIHK